MKVNVSIIVPIYNKEKYLKKCLESIALQDYEEYEVLLIDDGSTDDSKKICESYLEDNKFRYIYKENSGISGARNCGIDNAKGKYIVFVDADDYLEKGIISKLVKNAEKYNADLSFAALAIVDEDTNEIIFNTNSFNGEIICFSKIEYMCNILNEQIMDATMHTKLIKKECIGNIRFNTKTKLGEDLEFFYNIYEKLSQIVYQNIKGEYILQRKNSLSRANYDNRNLVEVMICKKNYEKITDLKLKEYAHKRMMRATITSIQKMLISNKEKHYNKDLKEYKKILKENKTWYIKSDFFSRKQKIILIICIYFIDIYKIYFKVKGVK